MRRLCQARSDDQRRVKCLSRGKRLSDETGGRKQAEDIRDLLAAAVEFSAEAVVLTDSRGFIRYVNSAFQHVTGYTRKEVMGKSPHFLDSGRHDETFYRGVREILSRDGVWRGQIISRKKDGALYPEDCTIALLKGRSDDLKNFISIRRDIMDKVRLEGIAEKVDAEKNNDLIVTGVRHEIGNVINSLAMLLGVARTKLDAIDKPAVGDYLDRALEEVRKGTSILQSLKNSNFCERPDFQNIGIPEFLHKFLELIKEDFAAKEIAINTTMETRAFFCFADPRLLHQILLNLMINAADALEGRDERRIALSVFREEDSIVIRLQDNGCGMSEEQLKNLFQPFHTTKARGTGLGLVIVKKLLSAINGSIKVTSLQNVGTTIDIKVPGQNREACEITDIMAGA